MHVVPDLNVNWIVQFIISIFVFGLGFVFHRRLLLNKNTCSKFSLFQGPTSSSSSNMVSASCAVCDNLAKKRCSRCKIIRYCSEACQRSHWISEHKTKCNNLKLISKANSTWTRQERKTASADNIVHHPGKILFPYDEFIELSDLEIPGFPPCGLLNCGNSCFANVVLQCLTYTKPFVAYIQIQGHKRECRRNDWCFLCEFQTHFERASHSSLPFSPLNILSRLPNIGGNLGHGSQEDAHEFMRFAIDTMQSVCLDQFGGEKAVHPRSQETTLIQHIFGGQLQSQVICTKCNNISNQLEIMMDLTVEIQGDAASLEECLDQFTVKERLHGENMYKCDRCNEHVTAWKRLSVRLPPNILTIALKRFQTGRFGKLNKRVTFPEKLDLGPYMSESGVDNEIYKLYGVIVHVDILNASYFGHYICYVKDFCGQWYRINDCKVGRVDVDEVLSQGAYMLLYSRARVRSRCMNPLESNGPEINKGVEHNEDSQSSVEQSNVERASVVKEGLDSIADSDSSAVTMNHLESNGPEIKKGIEHNEDSRPFIEQSNVECPSVVKEGVDSVGDSDSSAVTTNSLESIGPEITNGNEHNEDSQPSLEQPSVECPSVLPEDPDRVGDSVSSAASMTSSDVENDIGVEVSDEIAVAPSSDGIAIAPSESSNGLVPSSGDNSLSCKPMEDEAVEKIADTIIVSDVKDCTLGGNINNVPSSDGIAIAPSENSNGLVSSSDDNSLSSKSIEEDAIEEVADTILISHVKNYKSEGVSNNGSMKDASFTLANGKSETSSVKPGFNYVLEENKSGGDISNGPVRDTSFALANGKSETTSVRPGYTEHLASVARKCNGTDASGLKLKPIFSPGFLGKQHQKKGIKKTGGVLSKHHKPASRGNGFTNGNMHTLDHSFTDKQNPWGSLEGLSSNLRRDTDMVDVDVADQEARDLARREPPNRVIDINMVDVKELVQDKPDHW